MKQATETDYFKAWLVFFVVVSLGGGMLGFLIAIIGLRLLNARGVPLQQAVLTVQLISFLLWIPLSYAAFRGTVRNYLLPRLRDENPPKT